MISELFTVYLNRYEILLLVLHTQQSITIFFGTLQELNKFDYKPEFHLIAKYWNCSDSFDCTSISIKLEHEKVEQDPYMYPYVVCMSYVMYT